MTPHLYVGNRNYSSWSLRPWLCLRWAEIEHDVTLVDLDQPGYGKAQIAGVLAVSPTGRVPALRCGEITVYDSLAIAEWAAEVGRPGALLPREPLQRAQVRAATAEMHSGFFGLRRDLPMNIKRRCKATDLPADTLADIARVDQLWSALRRTHGARGPYLFGERTLADAFYAPVATRFRTYGIPLSDAAQSYTDTVLADPDFLYWEKVATEETKQPFSRANLDTLYAATP